MTKTVSRYWLTDIRGGKNKRYISSWRMSREEAASRGLTDSDIVPGTTEEREQTMGCSRLGGMGREVMNGLELYSKMRHIRGFERKLWHRSF